MKQVLLRLVNSYGFQSFITKLISTLSKLAALGATTPSGLEGSEMNIVEISKNNRLLVIHVHNNNKYEGKRALNILFNTIKSSEDFVNFGSQKVIFVMAYYQDFGEKSYHHNVLINNDTTFDEYWAKVEDYIHEKYVHGVHGYSQSVVNVYRVMVWNMDEMSNKNITITKNAAGTLESQITPRTVRSSSKGFLAGFPRSGFLNNGFLNRGFHTSSI